MTSSNRRTLARSVTLSRASVLALAVLAAVFPACGTRSGLLVDEQSTGSAGDPDDWGPEESTDADPPPPDASLLDAGPPDSGLPDVLVPPDVGPPDVAPPPLDAGSDGEIPPPGCTELADVLYLISTEGALYTFQPETLYTERVGTVDCGVELNSMAVARTGEAYVSSMQGELFLVDPRTASCRALPFDSGQLSARKFGMGFVATNSPRGEGLFIVEQDEVTSYRLSEIDLTSLTLRPIGGFAPSTPSMEVTGTGDGRLFGFHVANYAHGAGLVAIDKSNAGVLAEVPIEMATNYQAFHFAHWNGYIYIFITMRDEADASVLRFSLYDRSLVRVGIIDPVVVGAGVSTCAPL